jgi:cysteine synthase A
MATECRQRGVRFNAVVDPRASPLLIERMREIGADVAVVDEPDSSGGFLLNRIRHVQEQLRKRPGLVWTNQYESEANPNAHVVSTGPELREQVPGPTTVLVPVSTGGTLAGLTRFARISDAPWRFIGVDIFGSAALGRAPEERLLSGIGASRPSRFLDLTAVESLHVSSADAVLACLWLQNQAGIEVGGSSGATVAAAVQAFAADPGLTEVVCLCPDGADRYQTTIYRASWRAEHGIADALISGSVELLHVQ